MGSSSGWLSDRRSAWSGAPLILAQACLATMLPLVAPQLPAESPPEFPVEAFARLPVMSNVAISPGGRHIAAAMPDKSGNKAVVIFDLTQIGKKPPLVASTGDWDLSWLRWKSDERLLVSGRHSQFDGNIGIAQTRLIAVNADGSKLEWLVKPRNIGLTVSARPLNADQVVDFLPDDPQHVLMGLSLGDSSGPQLYRVDVENNRREVVESGKPWIQWWWRDHAGRVRLARGYDGYGTFDARLKTYYRTAVDADWQEIWDETTTGTTFRPVVFDRADPDVILVRSDHDGGRQGLYRYRLSSREFIEKLFLHPEVDLADVMMDARGREVEGVSYITDSGHAEWLSPAMAAIHRDLAAQLPGWAVAIGSRTRDDARMVVFAEAADHSGRYYLYEPASRTLRLFSTTYPALDEYDLARPAAVRYKARDGLEIPGYLTLPRGVRNPPERLLPAVVIPHGGPEARDYAAFNPEVQLLANRGYAVLQMNFRGSAGYGTAFRQAGAQEWGDAIQDDITDGARWLIETRVADPARICIVGGSFGGYAALMGVVREPALYRCAVSLNGLTDLPSFLETVGRYGGDRRWYAERIGKYWADGRKLAQNSPARRAADIRAPILLVQAVEDSVVPSTQAGKMVKALQDAGRTFRYVKLQNEDHWLSHGPARLQYFQELDAFLAEHLR